MNLPARLDQLKEKYRNFELVEGFFLRLIDHQEFGPLWAKATPLVFSSGARLDVRTLMSDEERAALREVAQLMGENLLKLNFGIFHKEQFIGWHTGDQIAGDTFYMRNSGVLPAFQGRGLYTAMLGTILPALASLGFQVVTSKHNASNNRVIIPKLKAGFCITGLELSDRFGTLVRLEYFVNSQRREVMDYRCGLADPPASIRATIGLP